MNIQQYISNNKCQTILHKILISRVTISFTELIQGITRGGSVHDSPWPGVQFGDPTKLSPLGFPLQTYTFAPNLSIPGIFQVNVFVQMILAQESAAFASRTLVASLSVNCPRLYASGCTLLKLCPSTRPAISLRVLYLKEHHENSSPVTRGFFSKFKNWRLNVCYHLFTSTPRDHNWCNSTKVSVLRNCVGREFLACGLTLGTSSTYLVRWSRKVNR